MSHLAAITVDRTIMDVDERARARTVKSAHALADLARLTDKGVAKFGHSCLVVGPACINTEY